MSGASIIDLRICQKLFVRIEDCEKSEVTKAKTSGEMSKQISLHSHNREAIIR